jgi:radical SAM protein with 4Fe4S-binding SPASM domain
MNFKAVYNAIFMNRKIGPEKVMISPTDRCNLKCKICWRLAKKEEKYDELSLEEIGSILKDCKELGTKTIDLTGGGEAFLRKDVIELLEAVKKHEFEGTLTTNGTLLTKIISKKLIEIGWDDICFSIESRNEKINDFIRGKGVFRRVTKNIKILNKLKKEFSSDLPKVRIATVITRTNYKNLYSVVLLAKKLKASAINFSVLIEWNSNKRFWMRRENEEAVKKYLEKAKKTCEKSGISSNLSSILKYGLFEHEKPKFCFAPWTISFINASGDVMPCCTLASLYSNVIGNVKKESFKDIWYGKKMNNFREKIKKGRLPSECHKCLPDFTFQYNEMVKSFQIQAHTSGI